MPAKSNAHRDKFRAWMMTSHGQEVLDEYIAAALKMKDRGFKHYSGQGIIHIVRYHRDLKHGPDSNEPKINNNYGSWLARYAMLREPKLQGFFEIREKGTSFKGGN